MKSVYGESVPASSAPVFAWSASDNGEPYIGTRARVAVYDAPAAAPYVEDVGPAAARDFIGQLAARVFELARARGGAIPYSVVLELAENLIHAGFADPVVSVLDSGGTIRFSDRGPGILDKTGALKPGFTTATSPMKDIIRGVGSGLPIVSDYLSVGGGRLVIEDNLEGGSVITIFSRRENGPPSNASACASSTDAALVLPDTGVDTEGDLFRPAAEGGQVRTLGGRRSEESLFAPEADPVARRMDGHLRLTTRQKQVLALILEGGSAGPSLVSRELGVGLSTAYRDLASLEDLGLIESEGGKRSLTAAGLTYLGAFSSSTV